MSRLGGSKISEPEGRKEIETGGLRGRRTSQGMGLTGRKMNTNS